MKLTEEQARKNECCRDRSEWCCASDCMAWRWCDSHFADQSGPDERKGYCGLAGKPEDD